MMQVSANRSEFCRYVARLMAALSASVCLAPACFAQVVPASAPPSDEAPVGPATAVNVDTTSTEAAQKIQTQQANQPENADIKKDQLEEIVVTAQKRAQNLQDVPLAVTAVTAGEFQRANIQNTADIATLVPSLNIQRGELNFSPYIRGVGTSAANAGADNSVQIFVDGVLIPGFTAGLSSLNNIAQIEVLKGPQGTLFGRNTTGGVISITTKTPSQSFHSDSMVSYGNYQTLALNQYLTGGIAPHLAADIAVFFTTQGKGYGKNVFTGNDVYKERDLALRTKWLWEPGANDTVTLSADYNKINSTVGVAETVVPGTFTNFGPGTTLASERADTIPLVNAGLLAPDFVVGTPQGHPPGSLYNINVVVDPFSKWWQWGASGKWRHDFGGVMLNYIGGYRKYREDLLWTPSSNGAPGQIAGWGNGTNSLTQELNVQSGASSRIQWVVGLYYLDMKVKYVHPFFIEGTTISGATIVGSGASRLNFYGDQTTKSYAEYGQATMPIFDKTNLTLGIRHTQDNKGLNGQITFNVGPLYLGFLPPSDQPEIKLPAFSAKDTFKKTTFRAALDHKFSDDVMGYASFNTGYKSGGYSMIPPDPNAYQPETLKAGEIGLKTELFGRRLRWNSAAFLYNWDNLQVTVYRNASAVTLNAAKARMYGIDTDFRAKLTNQFTLSGGFAFLIDKFTSYPNAPLIIPQTFAQGGGNLAGVTDATGNRLPYAPKLTATITGDYVVRVAGGDLALNATLYHNSGFYTEPSNVLHQKAYDLLNARIGWTAPDGRTTVALWGKNLLDKRYSTQLRANVGPNGMTIQTLAPPRTFGVSARYQF